jgi:hypothetical protein
MTLFPSTIAMLMAMDGMKNNNPNDTTNTNTNGPGGPSNTPDDPSDGSSIGASVLPVDCIDYQSVNPSLPCYVSPYNLCRQTYSVEVCDCEAAGGDLENCILENLNEQLQSNPYLLLEIDCEQIQNWQTLAQNEASEEILEKVANLPSSITNNFEIQTLEDANGSVINMDYFPVNITSLPNHPETGEQFTAESLLDYFRRNINFFVNGSGSSFSPYCEDVSPSICEQESNLWNSENPTGSIIYIDIPGDDGVVICSEYTNSYWYFMTMNAPYAGNHPVSGTRQFGYEMHSDGSYNFFVRGVDRINSFFQELFIETFTNADQFLGADLLWYTFQENLKNFVNDNGGQATVGIDSKYRPNWEDVKDVLLGLKPISELGCD